MKTLDEALRALAAKGEFSHVSIAHSPSVGFSAFCRGASEGRYGHGNDPDPVKATLQAIENSGGRKKKIDKSSEEDLDFG